MSHTITWYLTEGRNERKKTFLNSPLKDNECHFKSNFLKLNCKLIILQRNCGEKRSDICRALAPSASLPSQYGCTASYKVWKSTFVSIHMDFLDVLQTAGIISQPALLHRILGLTPITVYIGRRQFTLSIFGVFHKIRTGICQWAVGATGVIKTRHWPQL